MSTAEIIKSFNSIIESFLLQTSEIVGTTYYTYFKKVIKVNSLIVIENAIMYMLPYKEKIFLKDETYFSNENNYILVLLQLNFLVIKFYLKYFD